MSLSAETQRRVDRFRHVEDLYQPNSIVKRHIGERSLHMIVAPAVMGKTTVIRKVAAMSPDFGGSTTLSTREPRQDDADGYRLLEHNDENINALLDKILVGSLVQYKIHPTEFTFYGSEAQDHPHQHNMLAMLSGGINQLQGVGFGETSVIGLVSPPNEWSDRFERRYPSSDPHRLKRLREAAISYTDLMVRSDVHWVINREGYPDEAANQILKGVEAMDTDEADARAYVHRILQLTEDKRVRTQSQKYE